ncbi:MAG: hypothetical protein OES38_07500 [Gammaproteobacteria bacterium]|nr:hypothetical protein [Gammaproteobacteria bacterium]
MTYVLEVNDSELSLYRDESLEYHAPGIAVVRQGEILFGEPALRLSRTHPRETNQQYFARLNADPLAHPVTRASNHADLVYLHLQELQQIVQQAPAELVLAVPGILSADQLGVLLGIAQECALNVEGFVDSAVVAASLGDLPETTYHVDTLLQRACVTRLENNAEVRRESAEEVSECGFANLLDGWVNVIADRFVRDTRFDPLHAAETEQQLYNQVYDWVAAGDATQAEIGIEIDYRDHVRRVELPRSLLEEKAQQRFNQLRDALPTGTHVVLSARSARLPGMKQFLANNGHEFTALPGNAVAMGCTANMADIRSPGGQLRLVSRLPRGAALTSGDASARAPVREAPRPTHVLNNNTATRIDAADQILQLSETEAGVMLDPPQDALLNGEKLTAQTRLQLGDEITAGSQRFVMIRVDD